MLLMAIKSTIGLLLSFTLISCSLLGNRNHLGQKLIAIEDFFKNPQVSQYAISPDGQYLAFLKPYKNRMNVHVQDVERLKPEMRLTSQTDRDIAGFFWKENNTIIFMRDFGGDENFHLFRVSIDGSGERDLTPFEETRVGVEDDLEGVDETSILISMNKRDKKVFDVYRLNVSSGELTMVTENPGTVTSWLTDHKGQLRVAVTSDGVNSSVLYRENEKQKFRTLKTVGFKDRFQPLLFDFNNKNLFVLSNLGRDKLAIVAFDPIKKRELKIVYGRDDVDLSSLSYSKKRKVLTTANFITWKSEKHFFDAATKEIYQELQKQLPNEEITVVSQSLDETKMVIRTYSDRTLGAFYLFETEAQKLTQLAEVSPWLKRDEMAEMKPIEYTSRDGLKIPAYLTLPVGSTGKNLPTIILPHGGPWHRDVWGFRPDVQFLANRGYVVLQMNFRGSTGYGRDFWKASFKQWGKTMQNDISDGVQYLIDQQIANKDRVGIYGGSYGGYAVLAGLAFTPDLYAAGVDYVGVSNLFTLIETFPPYWKPMLEKFYAMVGHPEKEKELLREISPVFHADKIKAPLMVVQGAKDPRVKKAESDQIVEALKKRGIDVPYIVKEDEGHGFRNEENKLEMYAEMEKFLAKHLLTM